MVPNAPLELPYDFTLIQETAPAGQEVDYHPCLGTDEGPHSIYFTHHPTGKDLAPHL